MYLYVNCQTCEKIGALTEAVRQQFSSSNSTPSWVAALGLQHDFIRIH